MTDNASRDEAIFILIGKVESVATGQAAIITRLDRIEAKIGDYPSAVDLARESIQDLTPEQVVARESGTGICANLHQLAKNDVAVVAEVKRVRGDVTALGARLDVLQSTVKETEPANLARTSDRKSNLAALLSAASLVGQAILAALRN